MSRVGWRRMGIWMLRPGGSYEWLKLWWMAGFSYGELRLMVYNSGRKGLVLSNEYILCSNGIP